MLRGWRFSGNGHRLNRVLIMKKSLLLLIFPTLLLCIGCNRQTEVKNLDSYFTEEKKTAALKRLESLKNITYKRNQNLSGMGQHYFVTEEIEEFYHHFYYQDYDMDITSEELYVGAENIDDAACYSVQIDSDGETRNDWYGADAVQRHENRYNYIKSNIALYIDDYQRSVRDYANRPGGKIKYYVVSSSKLIIDAKDTEGSYMHIEFQASTLFITQFKIKYYGNETLSLDYYYNITNTHKTPEDLGFTS